jgi:hypothetical protein
MNNENREPIAYTSARSGEPSTVSEARFTPGPWHVCCEGAANAGPDDGFEPVGGCGCCGSPWVNGETEAERDGNARLIAAAPDLLAALIGLLPQTFHGNVSRAEKVAHWEREREAGNENALAVLAAFAAVAKAEGSQP